MTNIFKKIILLSTIFIFSFLYLNISIKKINKTNKYINVEVRGEVKNELSLNLPLGATFNDLLNQIELTEFSDISSYSLNKPIADKEIINIRSLKKDNHLISINKADLTQLESLEGIGKTLAQNIIDYRNNIHSFNDLDELMNVNGIGQKKYAKIKDKITL